MTTPAKELLQAVNFLMPIQKKRGTVNQQFCYIGNGWIAAADDYMSIAVPIETPIEAFPNTFQLRSALLKCGEDLSITKLNPLQIAITSGSFKAIIGCTKELELKGPDQLTLMVDDKLKKCFKATQTLPAENSNRPEFGAIKLADGCCTSLTPTGTALLQAWHGFNVPGAYLVPVAASKALVRSKEPLIGLGYTENSITFHFASGAFIKTALHSGNFPGIEHLFNVETSEPYEIPDDFAAAVKAIQPFSKEGFMHFRKGCITSDVEENEASTYKFDGLPEDKSISIPLYLKIKDYFQNARFSERSIIFQKDNVRGVIALVGKNDA